MHRRHLITTLAATGLAPTAALAAGVVEGQETWSESAMVLMFDPDGRNGLSLRISRYPDMGRTWVWCHMLVEGEIFAFTDQNLASTADHITAETPTAIYGTPSMEARISRLGPSTDLTALSFSFRGMGHRGRRGVDGRGPIPMSAEGIFHRGLLKAGSRAGRYEWGGRVDGQIRVGSRLAKLGGLGKAHEQTQTAPRFTTPFTYAMMWGPTASFVAGSNAGGGYGDLQTADTDRVIRTFAVEAWKPERRFRATFTDGGAVDGVAHAVRDFDVPVFDKFWRGHVCTAEVGGHRMVGMINDWKPEERKYATF